MRPAAALREQMERFRALNFDTDEENNNQEDQVEETVTMVLATPDNQNNNAMDTALAPATPDNQNDNAMDTAVPMTPSLVLSTPQTPMVSFNFFC